jgi:hypothetical protein
VSGFGPHARHIGLIRAGVDADYDRIHVQQVGPDREASIVSLEREILPAFR